MHRILIADGLAKEGIEKLKALPQVEILVHDALDREEIKKLLQGNLDILIVRSRTQVDRDLLATAKNLKVAIRAGIGLDNIDVPAATERGIVVMNAPTGNIVTTAEHALAMIFAATRNIAQADASLRSGKWDKKKFQGNELRNKTLGLVGLGNIGKCLAERATGIGMKVVAYDPYVSAETAAKFHVRAMPFDELLKVSDYISIHVPLTETTKHLFGKDTFLKMKKGAYLINCARGGIVDEAALMEALDKELLSGAALDVFEQEPLPKDSPLLKRNDIVMTPHLGASTDEAQLQVSMEVAEQVGEYLNNGVVKNAVNVPNVTLEQARILRPFIDLGERLGSLMGQIGGPENLKKIRVHYEGTVTTAPKDILTLSVLKGFLTPLLSQSVNFVNARNLLKERGIRIEESFEDQCADFASLIQITLEGDQERTVAGTIYGKGEPRLVQLDHFRIDAIPKGFLLYSKNVDQPGVIGSLGSVIGKHGVNIAAMHLGRSTKAGEAIAMISVDSEPTEALLQELRKISGMISVTKIKI